MSTILQVQLQVRMQSSRVAQRKRHGNSVMTSVTCPDNLCHSRLCKPLLSYFIRCQDGTCASKQQPLVRPEGKHNMLG